LQRFDSLATDRHALAETFSIPLLDDGIKTKQEVLSEIVKEGSTYGEVSLALRFPAISLSVHNCAQVICSHEYPYLLQREPARPIQ
jgi:hypothetical protein